MRELQRIAPVAVLLLTLACAGVRPVTVGGLPADEFVSASANRIYNLETGMVIAVETLANAREAGLIGDATWAQVKSASTKADAALTAARNALLAYSADGGDGTALTRALAVLDAAARTLLALTEVNP